MNRMMETYWNVSMEEGPMDLEEFLRQVKSGKHGSFSSQEIADFLDEMLATMLSNIQLKTTESPHFEAMREQAEEQTEALIARLRREYATE